jgi:hypothetical protein
VKRHRLLIFVAPVALLGLPACFVQTEGITADAGPPGEAGPPGPKGDPGPADTSVALALQNLADEVATLKLRVSNLESLECPRIMLPDGTMRLYQRTSTPSWIECEYPLSPTLSDTMVRVGDYWIDQFEASLGAPNSLECPGSFGDATGYGTTARPCSIKGVLPSGGTSQLQAAAACANAGKHLCSNIEWQTAASGTPDPGAWPDTGGAACTGPASTSQCNTCAGSAGKAGEAKQCVSRFGAFDMIGNQLEWVAEWLPARAASFPDPDQVQSWPPAFGNDQAGAFPSAACVSADCAQTAPGMLAAVYRGGYFGSQEYAGAFYTSASGSPGVAAGIAPVFDFRCCAASR